MNLILNRNTTIFMIIIKRMCCCISTAIKQKYWAKMQPVKLQILGYVYFSIKRSRREISLYPKGMGTF